MSETSADRRPGRRRGRHGPWQPEVVEVRLDAVGQLGECVGRLPTGQVVFAAYGLPGETVAVEVDERKSTYLRGRVVKVLDATGGRAGRAGRIEAPCPLFGSCGGCSWQHVPYEQELAYKEAIVVDQLRRIGGFDAPPVRPIAGAATPWRYRNQGRFSVRRDGQLGFTRRRSRATFVVEDCLLMQEPIARTLAKAQGHLEGRLHQLVIRHGARTGETLVSPRLTDLDEAGIPTGQRYYTENLLGRRFQVAANAFFQVNTLPAASEIPPGVLDAKPTYLVPVDGLSQADLLALIALDRLALDGGETLLDAYCGVGTFALLAAWRASSVVGIEESVAAVEDARMNGEGVPNAIFHAGRVEEVLPKLDERFDAVLLDPARVGCAPATLGALVEMKAPKVVYVSCDPATLARDLKTLCASGYDLVDVQPIDMFPRTYHVECVASLRRG